MSNLVILSATRRLYIDTGIFWLDSSNTKHYIEPQICPSCSKESLYFTGNICDKCWFEEQLKLEGGQYL